MFNAIERYINGWVVANLIPLAEQLLEYVFIGIFITPLFLVNQISTAVDIFAGVRPIYQLDRADADNIETVYDASPHYMLWKEEYERTPPYPVGYPATQTEIEHEQYIERLKDFFYNFHINNAQVKAGLDAAIIAEEFTTASEFANWNSTEDMKRFVDYLDVEELSWDRSWEETKYDIAWSNTRAKENIYKDFYNRHWRDYLDDDEKGLDAFEAAWDAHWESWLEYRSVAKLARDTLQIELQEIVEWQETVELPDIENIEWTEVAVLPDIADLKRFADLGWLWWNSASMTPDEWLVSVKNMSNASLMNMIRGLEAVEAAASEFTAMTEYMIYIQYVDYLESINTIYRNAAPGRLTATISRLKALSEALITMQELNGSQGFAVLMTHAADIKGERGIVKTIEECESVINHERSMTSSAANAIKERWVGFIQNNGTIILRQSRGYSDPTRYMPYVREFLTENDIRPGSDEMYSVLAGALCMGYPIGSALSPGTEPETGNPIHAVTAEYILAPENAPAQVSPEALVNTAAMPESVHMPYFEYTDPKSETGYYLMFEWYEARGRYSPVLDYDETVKLTKKEKKELAEVNKANTPVYLGLFRDTLNGGYAAPGYIVDRLEFLRANPVFYVNGERRYAVDELDVIHDAGLMDRGSIGYYMTSSSYSYANDIALNAVAAKKKKEDIDSLSPFNPTRRSYYFSILSIHTNEDYKLYLAYKDSYPSDFHAGSTLARSPGYSSAFFYFPEAFSWSPSFFMTYGTCISREDPATTVVTTDYAKLPKGKSWADYDSDESSHITIACFYPANALWVDAIQNSYDIVQDHTKGYSDRARYTVEALEFINGKGVTPGSDAMYKAMADAIMNYEFLVRDIPVNRWLGRDLGYTPYLGELTVSETAASLDAGIRGTLLGYFFENEVVNFVFWGITIISLALCIGFSIYAVTRSMGDLGLQKPVSKVLGLIGKSMLTFLIIPVFVVATLSLAGMVLTQATALITDPYNKGVTVPGALFTAAVVPEAVRMPTEPSTLGSYMVNRDGKIVHSPMYYSASFETRTNRYNILMNQYMTKNIDFSDMKTIRRDFDIVKIFWPGHLFSITICSWVFVVLLVMVMFVFIRRIFEIIMLYIVSPFFTSTIPLDDGLVFKNWRERFIGQCISGFGSLITMKLFLLLLPLIWSPGFELVQDKFGNSFLKCLLTLGGVLTVYKSHTMITSLVSPQAEESEKGMLAFAATAARGPLDFIKSEARDFKQYTQKFGNMVQRKKAASGGRGSSSRGGGSYSGNKNPGLS